MISCPYFLLTQLMRSLLFCDHFIVVFHSQMMTEHKIMKPLIQMSDAQCKGNCIKVPAYQSAYLPKLTKMIYCGLHMCFFYHSFILYRLESRTRPTVTPCDGRHWWDPNQCTPTCESPAVQLCCRRRHVLQQGSYKCSSSSADTCTCIDTAEVSENHYSHYLQFHADLFSLVKIKCCSCSQTLFWVAYYGPMELVLFCFVLFCLSNINWLYVGNHTYKWQYIQTL